MLLRDIREEKAAIRSKCRLLRSQFTAEEGAGKIAVLDLMTRFLQGGGRLFDLQYDSVHVRNLGARPVPRATYLDALRQLRTIDVGIPHGRRSAEHIAELVPT